MLPLIPPIVALTLILVTRQAALSLGAAVVTGVFLIHNFAPIASLRALFEDHLFPALIGPWNLSAIIFTLTLGAFATVLEKGGGFTAILQRFLSDKKSENAQKRLLFGIYGLGLLCFFDGLANSVLLGRVGRPLTDALRVSRQFLAYLIDSTAACVACVAFISTWIATQLAYIQKGLDGSVITNSPASLFFASIPGNPYCLLTLLLIPLVILKSWHLGPMKHASLEKVSKQPQQEYSDFRARTSLIPLASLVISLPTFIYLWQDGEVWSWQNAFSSDGVPYAMTAAGFFALAVACMTFPKARRKELPEHLTQGAASLFPALIILICAWSLGSVFSELGTAQMLSEILKQSISLAILPLTIFILGAVMSFLTGTSWGTMGLLMPIVLPLALNLGADAISLPMTIGAVFGGAVFGDHCSPFSDTTIVSALAAGCTPTSHVITQLPYAGIAAGFSIIAYTLMAFSIPSLLATLIAALGMSVLALTRKPPLTDEITNTPKARLE